jgi:hypothetical protein
MNGMLSPKGSVRIRWPVDTKTAFTKAGAAAGVPTSPIPRMWGAFSRMRVWMIGD